MKILAILFVIAGCNSNTKQSTNADTTKVPVGPGTDTSVIKEPPVPGSPPTEGR